MTPPDCSPELLGPAATFDHSSHPQAVDVNAIYEERLTLGQKVADKIAAVIGGWPFIIIQSLFLVTWIAFNVILASHYLNHPGVVKSWDAYPFILLNLMLSFQAAYTGPIVMMSQNRQSSKDRLMAQHDYELNVASGRQIRVILEHLVHQDKIVVDIVERLDKFIKEKES